MTNFNHPSTEVFRLPNGTEISLIGQSVMITNFPRGCLPIKATLEKPLPNKWLLALRAGKIPDDPMFSALNKP